MAGRAYQAYGVQKCGPYLPWAKLIAPAIALSEGHVLDEHRARALESERDRLALFPASAAQFLVNGHGPAAGSTFSQPDLARTLRLIADSGPNVFYKGQIADLIVAEMKRGHGIMTKADLAGYQAKWRTPITVTYRGYRIYSMPPASSGGVTMAEIFNVLGGYDSLSAFGSGPVRVHPRSRKRVRGVPDGPQPVAR